MAGELSVYVYKVSRCAEYRLGAWCKAYDIGKGNLPKPRPILAPVYQVVGSDMKWYVQ